MATRQKSTKAGSTAPSPVQIATHWSGGKIPALVLIVGPERGLRDEAIQGIRKAAFGDGDGGLSWVVLHGPHSKSEADALDPATILDEVCTRSMFADPDEPKIVLVRNAEILLGKAATREPFERNQGTIPTGNALILEVAEAGTLKSTNFYKKLNASGAVIACDALVSSWGNLADQPLVAELEHKARTLNLRLSARVATTLMERSGHSLGVLEEELGKLSLVLGEKKSGDGPLDVTEADIHSICSDMRLVGAFEFADAVCDGKTALALEALYAIFAHGLGDHNKPGKVIVNESNIAMRLMGALTWKMGQLQDIVSLLEAGLNEQAAFKEAKIAPFMQHRLRFALKRFDGRRMRDAMEALFRAQLALRTGTPAQQALETLVWRICRS